jgi:hypothetical protein
MPLFVDALKEYNKSETKWTIPKKGIEEYNKVRYINSRRTSVFKEGRTEETEARGSSSEI